MLNKIGKLGGTGRIEIGYSPGVFSAISAVTIRYRRLILIIAVALAAVLVVSRGLSLVSRGTLAFAILFAILLAFCLALIDWLQPRPAALLVKPAVRAFTTRPRGSQIYIFLGLMFVASANLGDLLITKRMDLSAAALLLLFVLLVGWNIAVGWRDLAVQLRPDGIRHSDFAGSLMVPWEALAPGHPSRPAIGASTLSLTYTRPDLVRRHGILVGRRQLRIDTVHSWFIADAIRHYVDHPQHRAAIGEPAEYHRLSQALTSPPTSLDQSHTY